MVGPEQSPPMIPAIPDPTRSCANRPLGPGRTVWLASYPKSGNTWMRAIITALGTHRHLFAVNQLGSGSQPNHLNSALSSFGLDPRWLDRTEGDALRSAMIVQIGTHSPDAADPEAPGGESGPPPPIFRKTHEVYRGGPPGAEPFPLAGTRAAILVVRDPRDVACSYAPFFGVDLPEAVSALARDRGSSLASPARMHTAQPWGSWSSHGQSWLAPDVPFPVHVIRYEDLQADAVATCAPVFAAVGLATSDAELQQAVEQARFDRLASQEAERGFRETSPRTRTFFRKGRTGGWREELPPDLVAAVEADQDETMARFGYEFTTEPADRTALADVRASRSRQDRSNWLSLPPHLGISVSRGDIPTELPDAEHPKPWIQVLPDQALVRFQRGAGLYVRDGRDVTVSWEPDPAQPTDDPSWLIQGWAVTLAMLQRGELSLHAATIGIGNETIAVAGHRGAGKSTTAMGLRNRGHRLLVDDVTLIEFHDGTAWTTPFPRNVHLLPDAAAAVGLDFEALPMLAGGRVKAAFRAEDPPVEPRRIDRIVVLAPQLTATEVTVTEAHGAERLATLVGHTRRDGIAPLVLGHSRYFELLARLADTTEVFVVRRPRQEKTLAEVLDVIESLCNVDSAAPAPVADGR